MKKLFLFVALFGMSAWAQSPAQISGLRATRFVVTEAISLLDTNGKIFRLMPGLLPLSEPERLNELVDSDEAATMSSASSMNLFRGGDGEPPRGPVRIEFRNDVRSGRGVLDMRFDNHRALFWLDHPVETNENTGAPNAPALIQASAASSGQNIGLRLSVSRPTNGDQPLTLLLIEKDLRPVADVELVVNNSSH